MKITNGRDFWAGVMFIAFGLGFLLLAIGPHRFLVELAAKLFDYKLEYGYAMGNAVRMGPAYFPCGASCRRYPIRWQSFRFGVGWSPAG